MLFNNIKLACQCKSITKFSKLLNSNYLRLCSTKINSNGNSKVIPPTTDSTEWITLYKFSHMRFTAGLNKLKIYQTLATCIVVPGSFALETCSILPANTFLVCAAIGKPI